MTEFKFWVNYNFKSTVVLCEYCPHKNFPPTQQRSTPTHMWASLAKQTSVCLCVVQPDQNMWTQLEIDYFQLLNDQKYLRT